jgi:hypothetical protein
MTGNHGDPPHFDLVHACDPRYRAGTAAALRGEIAAAHAWGLSVAVQPFLAMSIGSINSVDPALAMLLDRTETPFLTAETSATCDVLLAHHPAVFQHMADRPVRLRPKRVVLVLHHPPVDANSTMQYDLARIRRALERLYAVPVWLAPISSVVRRQLDRPGIDPALILPYDLTNVVNLADWPPSERPQLATPDAPVVIGRHSRGDPLKWPTDPAQIRGAWPDQPGIIVRILGQAHLPDQVPVPPNWSILPFQETGVSAFLKSLDFYVYFHHPRWVEAFGIAIAEAMATGLVTILPPHFEKMFGNGAVYAQPHEVPGLIARYRSRPDEYVRQSRAARRLIEDRYSIEAYKGRMQRLWAGLGLPFPDHFARTASPLPAMATPNPPEGGITSAHRFAVTPARQRILMICGNGVGLGHVTRLLAISRRLPAWIEPVVLTLSPGAGLLRAEGLSVDYFASHMRNDVTGRTWNDAFAVEVQAALDATGARLAVFDGNDAFPGLARLISARSDVIWLWIRRGLWRSHHLLNPDTPPLFNMVIEPADLAGDEDAGATAGLPKVQRVGPVLCCNPDQRLDRAEAAARLGINPARRTVAVQLGAGRNFDMTSPREAILHALAQHDVQVVEIVNPLAQQSEPRPGDPHRLSVYPAYPLSKAFDLSVLAPGYNSFHEAVYAGMPAIFVPNQGGLMDDQHLRAAYAQTAGLGLCLTAAEAHRATEVVAQALAPDFADEVARRSARLAYADGAAAIARHIEGQLASVRTARPLALSLPRL